MLTRKQKEQIVEDLSDKIKRQKSLIFIDAKGVKVGDIQKLKRELKKVEAEYRVAKKTLIDLALKKEKKEMDISDFSGSLAIGLGYKDPISLIKIFAKFAKGKEGFKILGGLVEDKIVDAIQIKELSRIPLREELLAKLVWSIKAPISGFVNVLQGNLRNLVGVLNAIKSNK
jgi:large subunit ribosomal protein L10